MIEINNQHGNDTHPTKFNRQCELIIPQTYSQPYTLSKAINAAWFCIIAFLHPPVILAMRYIQRMRIVQYAMMMAPRRPLKCLEFRRLFADSLNSPRNFRIRKRMSIAIRQKTTRVATWDARPTIMILFPVLGFVPWEATAAPVLWIKSISALKTQGNKRKHILPLNENGSYVTKYEDPNVPFGHDAGEFGAVDNDASMFSL